MKVPLRIHVLFQPRTELNEDLSKAEQLASHIYKSFLVPPSGRGARIPVRFGPVTSDGGPASSISMDDAVRNVVVVLCDRKMSRRQGPMAAGDFWEARILDIKDRCEVSPMNVFLPVAIDDRAFDLSEDLQETSFVRVEHMEGAERERHLLLHVATRALRLFQNQKDDVSVADVIPQAPLQIFVSHAKKDLPTDLIKGPVKTVLSKLSQGPVAAWYDAAEIDAGARFKEAIELGVSGATVLVVVLTDAWSTREWCRREILLAKKHGVPIVVVGALQNGCERLFPYIGNCATVQWRAATLPEPEQENGGTVTNWWEKYLSKLENEDADRTIVSALMEALRHQFDRYYIDTLAKVGEVVLGDPPEAITIDTLDPG